MRAIVSVSRTSARRRSATIFSSLSPAGWPSVSLTCLEVVEIEQMGGHDLAALDAGQRMLEPLVEQHAVGQVGQRVVQRHVRDLGLGAALLGDVLVRGDGAAVGHRLRPTRRWSGRRSARSRSVLGLVPGDALRIARRISSSAFLPGNSPAGDAMLEDLAQRRAGPHLLRRQAVHLGIALVADDEPLLASNMARPCTMLLRAASSCRFCALQLLLVLLQQLVLLLEPGVELLALGDVLVRD